MKTLHALLIGPVFANGAVGGLELALSDVAEQLKLRGWQVDSFIRDSDSVLSAGQQPQFLKPTFHSSRLEKFQTSRWLPGVWHKVPVQIRQLLSAAFMSRQFFREASHDLYVVEQVLTNGLTYDLVLVCADFSPPGLLALVSEKHPRVAIISLGAISSELKAWWWAGMRLFASARTTIHTHLYRQVSPQKLKAAIFASAQWQQDALRSGLPAQAAHIIYFGIPAAASLPRKVESSCRLLWVARLSPEKGLHLFLLALTRVRQEIENLSLTVVAAQGSSSYRRHVHKLVRDLSLGSIVSFHGPVPRAALQHFYAQHEMLLFHSIFAESVSLVLMEAMAAGLPVVTWRPRPASPILKEGITCVCYDPQDVLSLVQAIINLHRNQPLRESLAIAAKRVIQEDFTVSAMGRKYDVLLRGFVGSR